MDSNYLFCFALGALGALIIVWLRWIDALPRFKSAIEISLIEDDYSKIREHIVQTIKDGKTLDSNDLTYSENLRRDIQKQRTTSFLFSSILYTILGGATALIFVGLDAQNLSETTIIKLIGAGALWSSFYSFLDVKNTDSFNITKQDEENDKQMQIVEDLKNGCNTILSEMEMSRKTDLIKANEKMTDLITRHNDLVEKYERLQPQMGGADIEKNKNAFTKLNAEQYLFDVTDKLQQMPDKNELEKEITKLSSDFVESAKRKRLIRL